MDRYICTVDFEVEEFDEDGFCTGEYMTVYAGEIYQATEDSFRVVGGEDTIHLDGENGNWLELLEETINANFKLLP